MKRELCIALSVMLLTAAGGNPVYADDAVTAPVTDATQTITSVVPDMNFIGPEIKLSIKQATERMMTSSTAITAAQVQLAQDKAATETSLGNLSKLNSLSRAASKNMYLDSPSKTQKEMAKLTAEYKKSAAQSNYDAAVNKMQSELINQYYTTLQAQDQVRISKENVSIQETLLKNVKLKFSLGTASKQDVLQAEVALNQKKVQLEGDETALAGKQMAFNQYFGYPVMQKIALTDSLTASKDSALPLGTAINNALSNRLEMSALKYAVDINTLNIKELQSNYASNSSAVIEAKADLLESQNKSKDLPNELEMDVRGKYMTMQSAKSAMGLAKSSLDLSTEASRLAQLSYDAGLKTLTEVLQAQVAAYDGAVAYSKSILSYNLAILAYEQSATVGTGI